MIVRSSRMDDGKIDSTCRPPQPRRDGPGGGRAAQPPRPHRRRASSPQRRSLESAGATCEDAQGQVAPVPRQCAAGAATLARPHRRPPSRPRGPRSADTAKTLDALASPCPRRPADPRQPRVGQLPAVRQPGRASARRCSPSSPTTPTPSSIVRLVGNTSIDTEGQGADAGAADHRQTPTSTARTVTVTGAPVLLKEHQRLPQGRHAHPGRHRGGRHDHHPAAVVQRPVAPAAAGRDPGRRHVGLRPGRVPAASP